MERDAVDQRFFALLFLLADVAFAVRRFRVAAAFLPAATRFVDFRAVDLLAVDFLRAGLRAVDFLAVDFLRAGLRAVDFLAVDFLLAGLRAVLRFRVAAAFFAAVFRRAVVRFRVAAAFFAAVFRRAGLRAADFLAVDRLRAVVFLAAIPVPLSFVFYEGSWVTTPSV